MKKILLSIGSILFASALLAGGTGAFFNQNPWGSTGNTFATGVVDLKIDNESYITNNQGVLVVSTSTTWATAVSNLAGKFFFKFNDVKPGDLGEDTISLHIKNNDAWACMNVKLTATPENGIEEPEQSVDSTAGANQGELQNVLSFVFWADDGDNVFETGETIFKQGLVKDIFTGAWWTLADSSDNLWSAQNVPIAANSVRYVGKAWCYGTLSALPVAAGNGGPLVRGTGFSCNGSSLNNLTQSDGISVDVNFTAEQYRSNKTYLCSTQSGGATTTPPGGGGGNNPPDGGPPPTPTATSTLFVDDFQGYAVEHFFDDNYNDVKWDVGGDDVHVHNESSNRFANLEGGHSPATQSLITQSISTLGKQNITLKYDRKTDDTSGAVDPQTLVVAYSVNGGSTWTTLETVTGEAAWTAKTWNLSPTATNKASIKVRFVFNGTNGTNHAYIDNVSITGITI